MWIPHLGNGSHVKWWDLHEFHQIRECWKKGVPSIPHELFLHSIDNKGKLCITCNTHQLYIRAYENILRFCLGVWREGEGLKERKEEVERMESFGRGGL